MGTDRRDDDLVGIGVDDQMALCVTMMTCRLDFASMKTPTSSSKIDFGSKFSSGWSIRGRSSASSRAR